MPTEPLVPGTQDHDRGEGERDDGQLASALEMGAPCAVEHGEGADSGRQPGLDTVRPPPHHAVATPARTATPHAQPAGRRRKTGDVVAGEELLSFLRDRPG